MSQRISKATTERLTHGRDWNLNQISKLWEWILKLCHNIFFLFLNIMCKALSSWKVHSTQSTWYTFELKRLWQFLIWCMRIQCRANVRHGKKHLGIVSGVPMAKIQCQSLHRRKWVGETCPKFTSIMHRKRDSNRKWNKRRSESFY